MTDKLDALLTEMGITPGPWSENKTHDGEMYHRACIVSPVVDIASMKCVWSTDPKACHEEPQISNDRRLLAASREMLKSLIIYVLGVDRLPPLTAIQGLLDAEYTLAVNAIESATPEGWTWKRISQWMEEHE